MIKIVIDTEFCGIKYEVRFLYEPAQLEEGSVFAPSEHFVPNQEAYISIREVYKITNTWGPSERWNPSDPYSKTVYKVLIDSKREPITLSSEEEAILAEIVLEQYEESLED